MQKNRYNSQINKVFQSNRSLNNQKYYFQKKYEDDYNYNKSRVCGIRNLGNNCYLSSGLQILASCKELMKFLNNNENNRNNIVNELKNALNALLSGGNTYNPKNFIEKFCLENSD